MNVVGTCFTIRFGIVGRENVLISVGSLKSFTGILRAGTLADEHGQTLAVIAAAMSIMSQATLTALSLSAVAIATQAMKACIRCM